ncbi:hypothetical protein B0T19DRAFT_430735 [Cercophora scortea]|uniref:Uncharacterized protein n=1 Tax=Cercophora scortea TaxID=314031 RepID=A0AAE0I9A4_9PEZI|nr:hypothetical protein B0T19DRAFT_430735 [Cercophora scortea]
MNGSLCLSVAWPSCRGKTAQAKGDYPPGPAPSAPGSTAVISSLVTFFGVPFSIISSPSLTPARKSSALSIIPPSHGTKNKVRARTWTLGQAGPPKFRPHSPVAREDPPLHTIPMSPSSPSVPSHPQAPGLTRETANPCSLEAKKARQIRASLTHRPEGGQHRKRAA